MTPPNQEKTMTRNTTSKTSAKTSTKSPSHRVHAKSKEQDALDILAEDHQKVLKMFDQFRKMTKKADADEQEMQTLVETACAELTIHSQVEEELFYPALRDASDADDLLDEAEVEHASAKQLITELAAMQPGDDLYDAKFTVLGEYVKHHIDEEEHQLFPKAKKAKMDLESLGEEIRTRKQELRDELGVGLGEEEEDLDEERETRSPAARRSVH
jgi:hemerythrin-like domain-containing protein